MKHAIGMFQGISGVIETCNEVCGVIETCHCYVLRIHGGAMFRGVEVFMMAPIENLTMENNERNLGRM